MKYLPILFFVLGYSPLVSFASNEARVEGSVKSFNDYVKIRYMPSRSAFFKKEPVTELKSESRTIITLRDGEVLGTNVSMKQIYDRAKTLKDKGTTTNQREFHVSTKKIEVTYMGQTVSLEYAGKSNSKKYLQYEKEWLELYDFVYRYLTKDINP